MSKPLAFLNSPNLGGAERSFLTQLGLIDIDFEVYVPEVDEFDISKELKEFAAGVELEVLGFEYKKNLYRSSRSNSSFNLINIIIELFEQILIFKKINVFKSNTLWCNGNKVFIPIFLGAILFRYQGRVLWHLRDYPSGKKLLKFLNFLFYRFAKFDLVLVGNSHSTLNSYSCELSKAKTIKLYNPTTKISYKKNKPLAGSVLGFAGMSAPWKGHHELFLWASLYEEELISIGIESINVYGSNIYLTKGEHENYTDQLVKLNNKFPSKLIKIRGLVTPEVLFNEIDIMLHLSNKKEPFGRVILESYGFGVPVISTGLGGAGELIDDVLDKKHFSYDYPGLFQQVKRIVQESDYKKKLVEAGLAKYEDIQKEAYSDLIKLKNTYFQ